MIDYTWVTEQTKQEYERVLRADAIAYLSWRAKAPSRRAQTLARSFRSWWNLRGRTGFKTVQDGLRFRGELLAYAQAMKGDLAPESEV